MNWDNFFIAQASAAAALTGLIFVAVSINLNRIITEAYLVSRALQSIILLVNVLLVSSLLLIPQQSFKSIGIEVLFLALILWGIILTLALYILRKTPQQYKKHARLNFYISQIAALPFVAAGICILLFKENGMVLLAAGILFSFVKAISDSWILLVEINR